MNILSLFDGMSCAQIALNRLGVKDYSYYASEIDKYSIKVTQANYPKTVQLGDITDVCGCTECLPQIDLLIGGSPCQGFSFAGKQLNFDDPRSNLFFEYVRLLKECNPKYFLLENVRMKKEYQDVISEALGVEPIEINSALVSAQNRKRLYWTNIPNVTQPEDRGFVLSDVIENGLIDRGKAHCLNANCYKGGNLKSYFEKHRRQLVFNIKEKHPRCDGVSILDHGIRPWKNDGRKGCLSECSTLSFADSKSRAVIAGHAPKIMINDLTYRKLSPIECERLQTVPDNYTNHVSNTQRYRMLGNGFTVDVIAHILKGVLKS